MTDGKVTLKGDREFQASYQRAMANVGRLDTSRAARTLQATVKQFAPVRTGYLRSSAVVVRRGRGGAAVQIGARYAGFVERGTRYMRGRRFAQRALDARRDDVTDQIGQEVQQELDHVRGA